MLTDFIRSVKNCHINKMTVKKEFRQKKIGKLLFLHFFKELLNRDVKCIQLEVSSLNLTAQKFYKDLNFIQDGLRRDYYLENEHTLLYTLRLKWLNGLDVSQIR